VPDDPRGNSAKNPEPIGFIRHVDVFFEDPTLRPLLIIFVVHVALAGALVLLGALRSGSLPSWALLAVLVALSIDAIRRARRRRRAAIWIVMLWVLSALTAVASSHLGLL
jgi:hypothetical protein